MADSAEFSKFISLIKSHTRFTSLDGLISEKFGSQQPGHRSLIRSAIVEKNNFTGSEARKILNLESRPQSEKLNFSISHSPDLSGFVQAPEVLGFDIEKISRMNKQVISRVSTSVEVAETPTFDYLWTAKEAAFKAISAGQSSVQVLSDVQIRNWNQLSLNNTLVYSFHCTCATNVIFTHNIGFSMAFLDHNWTIFFF